VDAVASAVDQALDGAGARAREIAGVGASVFWHSLLALDDARRPLLPVLTWADTRSAEAAAALRARLDGAAVHARTGAVLHASYYPARFRWLREQHADLFARAAVWCGFAEYLLWRLTGVLRASVSMASGTGVFDQDRVAWDALERTQWNSNGGLDLVLRSKRVISLPPELGNIGLLEEFIQEGRTSIDFEARGQAGGRTIMQSP